MRKQEGGEGGDMKTYTTHECCGLPKPAKQIRDARNELEDEVRESCLRFVERTGLAVTGINVDFMETTSIGKKFETSLQSVRVVFEDV